MNVEVRIPGTLRKFAGGRGVITLRTVGSEQSVDLLAVQHADLHASMVKPDGNLRPYVRIYVNQHRLDLSRASNPRLVDGDVVKIVTAIAGG